ncbi:cathepsin L1-like isoform X1 [Drosophila miranda]|uniref:cathepsin L1-like isoform X1 n=2 Tax=Drosophila miranda TaxID=7229 RepID=UPI0007E63ED6|nr:cathepsin L1-like isoform X1 [Drosophila miranda]
MPLVLVDRSRKITMKFLLVLPLFVALASAQFGGFGGGLGGNRLGGALSNAANRVQQGIANIASQLPSPPKLTNVQNFGDFLAQSGKNYLNAADKALHEGVFAARKNLVDAGNDAFAKGASSYQLAVNAFSDLTKSEFLSQLTGLRKSSQGASKATANRKQASVPAGASIPESFDWRQKGGVTSVKFQGTCGSCWAFATTGAIEGHIFRKTGTLPNLSEQNLVDCGTLEFGLSGCDGGFQEYAMAFINEEQKGVSKADGYPYIDNKDTCKYSKNLSGAQITGFATIPPKDETLMKKVIATLGPLACSLNGLETLLQYKSGIYSDEKCNEDEPNHSVLVVGYGSEKGQDYWIVKNSWDKVWGEEGYFRLPRGNNFCGIALECTYPIV